MFDRKINRNKHFDGTAKRLIWSWTGKCYGTIDVGEPDDLWGPVISRLENGETDIIVINRLRLAKNTNVL